MISEDLWDKNEFSDLKQELMKKLDIQHVDEISLQHVSEEMQVKGKS
jgi:hypothetical protein